jgi:hypothetical protein
MRLSNPTRENGRGLTMSNQWDDDDDDDFTQPEVNNDLVKQLRKANKQKEKELAELKANFESLNKAQRERAIKDVLSSRGINSKIAAFIPGDIDASEDAVSRWLDDYADVFGVEQPKQATPNVDPNTAKQYQKMTQTVEQGLSPEAGDDIMRRLMNANSKEELDAIIRESGL